MKVNLIQNLCVAVISSLVVTACAPVTPIPDQRTPEQKHADFLTASLELQGSYEVIESRNDDYGLTSYKSQRADVKISGDILTIRLIGQASTLTLYASSCKGSQSLQHDSYSLYCTQGMPGLSSISLVKQHYNFELKGGGKPLQLRKGDYLLNYFETPRGRLHFYILKKVRTDAVP
jgi:hypothetical protein